MEVKHDTTSNDLFEEKIIEEGQKLIGVIDNMHAFKENNAITVNIYKDGEQICILTEKIKIIERIEKTLKKEGIDNIPSWLFKNTAMLRKIKNIFGTEKIVKTLDKRETVKKSTV